MLVNGTLPKREGEGGKSGVPRGEGGGRGPDNQSENRYHTHTRGENTQPGIEPSPSNKYSSIQVVKKFIRQM